MAKTAPVLAAPTLSASKVKTIANVWIEGERDHAIAGGGLAIAIATAAAECGGNRTDTLAIANIVGEKRGWSPTTVGIRASQCLSFLNLGLPTLKRTIKNVTEHFDACSFEMAYDAAKAVLAKEDPIKAVQAAKDKKHGAAKSKRKAAKGKAPAANAPKTTDEAVPFVFRELLKLDLPRGLAFDLKALAAKYDYKL